MLRWIGILFSAGIALAIAFVVGVRFSDGPLGPFPGGALIAGPISTEAEIDWSFATPIAEIEFQLLEPARSRTVWLVVHEGELYIPCAFPRFRLWKQWPYEALEDGRAVLRIDGTLYLRQAVRVDDPSLVETLTSLALEKYEALEGASDGEIWYFRMDPRAAG
jgi:hypothetical protein